MNIQVKCLCISINRIFALSYDRFFIMNLFRTYILLTAVVIASAGNGPAQTRYFYFGDKGSVSIGAHTGAVSLFGDNQKDGSQMLEHVQPGYGFLVDYRLSPVVSLSGRYTRGSVSGITRSTGLPIQSDIYEGSVVAVVRLNAWGDPRVSARGRFYVYVFGGVGGVQYLSDLPLPYDGIAVAFPFGAGVTYRLSERWSLYLENGTRLTLTDELDGEVNGNDKDAYNYLSAGLVFRLFPLRSIFPCHF
jgi:opacity protein-like surface antigen